MSNDARLTLGGIDLMGNSSTWGQVFRAFGDDGSWGSPQSIDVTLQSLVQDGSVVVTQGYDNREASLRVRVKADDSAQLAAAEAALFAELGKRNTLTWVPDDGWAPPTVFEIITSRMEHIFDDLAETLRTERTYGITLVCEPFARSARPFTVAGTVATPDVTPPAPLTISDGTSFTNWLYSAQPTAAGTESSGLSTDPLLKYAYWRAGAMTTHWYQYTPITSIGGRKFLSLDWRLEGVGAFIVDGQSPDAVMGLPSGASITLTRIGQIASPDNSGFTRTLWEIPETVTTATAIRFSAVMGATGASAVPPAGSGGGTTSPARGFSVQEAVLTSEPLLSGTARQKTMTVTVPGSAPTAGSLEVSHPTTALGDLLVYSWADTGCGYAPPMRGFRTAGGSVTSDASLYSGASDNLSAKVTYRVPTSQLPEGLYVVYARVKGTTAGDAAIQLTASTWAEDGTTILPQPVTTWTETVKLATSYSIVPLGRVMLPTVAMPNGLAELTLYSTAGVTLDEVYLCNTAIGRTTIVNAGSLGTTPKAGGAPSTIWINSPSTDSPRPSITAGTQPDGSDAYNIEALASSSQPHRWAPPGVSVFTACNALDAQTTLAGYARWHTHAAGADGSA